MVGTTVAALMLASAATSAGTSIYAAKKQSKTAREAGKQQAASIDTQVNFEREQAAEDKRRFDATEQRNRLMYEQTRQEEQRRYDMDRQQEQSRWDTEQTRRTPYRAVSVENMNQLAAQTRRSSLADLAR